MDFANEYYVRLYVRDTTTWKRLAFSGQAVLALVLRKLDMAGVLDLEDMEPWEAAVLHAGIPEDIARDGMARCLERGVFVHRGRYLVAPRYRDANESNKSDRQRQAESRARRRAHALDETVTVGDQGSQPVTRGHAYESRNGTDPSRSVTKHHTRSHAVTLTNSSSNSDAVAASERTVTPSLNGNGSHGPNGAAATAPNGSTRVSARDAALAWQRVLDQCNPGAVHALDVWQREFDIVATVCNGVQGKPDLAMRVVIEWFWLGPDGPVASGRIGRTVASPRHLAKHISRDLEGALQWWHQRKQQSQHPEPHEAAQ